MQHAKRMVLVDEKFLEHMWRKEDSSWKRPTEQKVKSLLNRELKSDLDDTNIPDDLKVKQHQQHLNRFLQTKRQLPESNKDLIDFEAPESTKDLINFEPVKNLIEPTVGDLLGSYSEPIKSKKKKTSASIRRSKRKPKKIVWEEWTT